MNTAQDNTNPFDGAELVSTYSRAQCIADGYLVDVSHTAKEVGFKVPVAVSRAVWADCIEWDAEDTKRQTHQDQGGRLWDVLWMCFCEANRQRVHASLSFELYRIPRGGKAITPQLVQLKTVIGPGDTDAPVITILEPNED